MENKIIFIGGCPRSGTTWAGRMFRCHPSARFYYETEMFYSILWPFDRGLTGDEAWKFTLHNYEQVADMYSLEDLYNEGIAEEPFPIYHQSKKHFGRDAFKKVINRVRGMNSLSDMGKAAHAVDLLIKYLEYNETMPYDLGSVFVEKSPTNILLGKFILEKISNSKIINIVRDGRDVCVSIEMRSQALRHYPKKRIDQIKWWKNFINKGQELCANKNLSDRILLVRYEDLKNDQEKEIRRMFAFAGIDDSTKLCRAISEITDFKYLKVTGSGKFNRKGIIGDWKNHFTKKDIELFKKIANDELLSLGYKW